MPECLKIVFVNIDLFETKTLTLDMVMFMSLGLELIAKYCDFDLAANAHRGKQLKNLGLCDFFWG